jgi:hypothetical protein
MAGKKACLSGDFETLKVLNFGIFKENECNCKKF